MTENAKVRYGVLSTARIARNALIPGAGKAENSEIVAIASRDGDRAQAVADEFGIPRAYGSYEQLLADDEIDAVINPLPNAMHCEWTVRAAQAGKHILCEKPFAVTVHGARSMMHAAREHDVLLMEAFKIRFLPQQQRLRELLDAGELGDVKIVRAELTYTIEDWEGDSRARKDLGGGALWDAGCYCVNQIRPVMGEAPVSVQAYKRMHPAAEVDCTFVGILRFPGDRMAFMATGMEQPFRACCEVIGAAGRAYLPNLFAGREMTVHAGGDERKESFEAVDPHELEIAHFSDCILNGRAVRIPPEDSVENTAVLVALHEAADAGKEVPVSG